MQVVILLSNCEGRGWKLGQLCPKPLPNNNDETTISKQMHPSQNKLLRNSYSCAYPLWDADLQRWPSKAKMKMPPGPWYRFLEAIDLSGWVKFMLSNLFSLPPSPDSTISRCTIMFCIKIIWSIIWNYLIHTLKILWFIIPTVSCLTVIPGMPNCQRDFCECWSHSIKIKALQQASAIVTWMMLQSQEPQAFFP